MTYIFTKEIEKLTENRSLTVEGALMELTSHLEQLTLEMTHTHKVISNILLKIHKSKEETSNE